MNKIQKIKPLLFILIGLIFGFVYVKLNSTNISGKITSNDNSCANDKTASCILRLIDSQGNLSTVEYSHCSLADKYAPRGYVPASIYSAKIGDQIEVTGRIKGSVLKVCPGWIPPLQIQVVK